MTNRKNSIRKKAIPTFLTMSIMNLSNFPPESLVDSRHIVYVPRLEIVSIDANVEKDTTVFFIDHVSTPTGMDVTMDIQRNGIRVVVILWLMSKQHAANVVDRDNHCLGGEHARQGIQLGDAYVVIATHPVPNVAIHLAERVVIIAPPLTQAKISQVEHRVPFLHVRIPLVDHGVMHFVHRSKRTILIRQDVSVMEMVVRTKKHG